MLPPMFEALDETPLERSPIVAVIWQLRFEEHSPLVSPQSALRFRELLGGEKTFSLAALPRIQVSIQAGDPAAPEASRPPAVGAATGGWRLSAHDDSWHVNIEAASVSIEAAQYGSWADDFRPKLERVLAAIQDVGPPVIESRLGLRYINVIIGDAAGRSPFASTDEFTGFVAPWLLGPLTDERLSTFVDTSQGRVAFRFDVANAILNHGVVSAENGELGYLVDIDAFRDGARAFSAAHALESTALLHSVVLGLFQTALTVDVLNSMRGASSIAGG